MEKNKPTPAMREYLKLQIIRKANKDPEFKKKIQDRLNEIAEEQEKQTREKT